MIKDPGAFLFFLLVILGIVFEKISKFKKAREGKSAGRHKGNESAEQFFSRIKSEQKAPPVPEPEIRYEQNQEEYSSSLNTHSSLKKDTLEQPKKKKLKKTALDFNDKNKIKEAVIMKTILDRPQAYKF